MIEDDARAWIATRFPDRVDRLERVIEAIVAESERQNLISQASLAQIWSRHVVDSAQLIALTAAGRWVDIGTGGGFPGLVIAALTDHPVVMIEPRAKRAAFLAEVVAANGLGDATVVKGKAQMVEVDIATTVSARAVASIAAVFDMSMAFTRDTTRFLLPRGKTGRDELQDARRTWKGVFHVEHSITDPDSIIVVAQGVARR